MSQSGNEDEVVLRVRVDESGILDPEFENAIKDQMDGLVLGMIRRNLGLSEFDHPHASRSSDLTTTDTSDIFDTENPEAYIFPQ